MIKNIIDNAIKYTHQGGEVTVSISRLKREGIIRVTTSDDGIGIPADMMGRLFEKFSRGRGISKLHTEGRGLGLYVSKQIIAAHGGRIWAESKGKNLGTSFNLDFKDPAHERKRKEIKTFIEDL